MNYNLPRRITAMFIILVLLLTAGCGAPGGTGDDDPDRRNRPSADGALSAGDVLSTAPGNTARYQLEDGISVELGEETELLLESRRGGYYWRLESGTVTVNIEKPLSGGEEFVVTVGNVDISVRGTSYTLTLMRKLASFEDKLAIFEKNIATINTIISALENRLKVREEIEENEKNLL